MNKTYLGYPLTFLSALTFATMSLFTKMGYAAGLSPWSFSLIQSGTALVLLGLMGLRGPRMTLRGLNRPTVWYFLLCGAAAAVTFNLALVYLSMSLATILLFTYPVFTTLGAWLFLDQRPTLMHGVAVVLTLAGAVLTANLADIRAGSISLIGVVLALSSAVAQGLYIVTGEKIAGMFSATAATTLTRIAILTGSLLLNPMVFAELPTVTRQGWLIAMVTAAVSGVVPFLFLNRGIALIGANRAAIVSVVELPFVLALGLTLQGDIIQPAQWVGAALIIAAVIVSQQETKGESTDGSGAGTTGSL